MKVCIVAANNLRYSPYLYFYSEILERLTIDYDIIVPNRDKKIDEQFAENVIPLKWNNNLPGVFNYFCYSRKVKRICKKNYDFVIVLTTINAVCSLDWLIKKFNRRYIVDVRDYTCEKYAFFRKLEQILFSHSLLNVISSTAFKTFLPESDYCVAHNITTPLEVPKHKFEKNKEHIVIGYVGSIGYASKCEKLMDMVNTDSRFSFHFYGNGPDKERLQEYVKEHNYDTDRIIFWGAYTQNEKGKIIKSVDILFNCYGNGSELVRCALSNKLYDGMFYHKPILNSTGTYMDDVCGKMSFSMTFNEKDELEALWQWYQGLNNNEIDMFADDLYNSFLDESKTTIDIIEKKLTECAKDI
ncbi:MAG: glycosyltransferase family 4 protein [Lachnospiraceae bacterium]|nr:glycosyltransferase family 4 protein [Lachnospiraceae bacterium]